MATNPTTKLKTFLFYEARKASTAFVIAAVPAVVLFVQENWGLGAGSLAAAVATSLGVYNVTNKK